MITRQLLDSYLGKGMHEICRNGYDATDTNHCAHFVSHALNLDFDMTCRLLAGERARRAPGANVRVHEIFARCPSKHEIDTCTTELTGLVFVSETSNFVTNSAGVVQLRNVPRKHIGIILQGTLWHYSNPIDQIVRMAMSQFLFHYRRQTNALWFGAVPTGSRPIHFGQC